MPRSRGEYLQMGLDLLSQTLMAKDEPQYVGDRDLEAGRAKQGAPRDRPRGDRRRHAYEDDYPPPPKESRRPRRYYSESDDESPSPPRRRDRERDRDGERRRHRDQEYRPPPPPAARPYPPSDDEAPPPRPRRRRDEEKRPRGGGYDGLYDEYADRKRHPERYDDHRRRAAEGYYSDSKYDRRRPEAYPEDRGMRDRRDRDRFYGDRDRDMSRRDRPGAPTRSKSKWEKEAKDIFMTYALPVIKKEGGKYMMKQLGNFASKK